MAFFSAFPRIIRPELLDRLEPSHNYAWAGIAFLLGFVLYTSTRTKASYQAIPAIGSTGFFSSYLDAIRYLKHGHEALQEGYEKYKPGAFRIPEINGWHVMVSGAKLIEELRNAPDDVLSFQAAVGENLAQDWTLGPNTRIDPYHVAIVRGQLTRHLVALLPPLREEMELAFEDCIPVRDEWTKVKALETIMKIVSRTTNRAFVGAPTCRDPEYIALNVQFTIDVVIGSKIINLFPDFLKPLAGYLFTNVHRSIRTGVKHLKPIIEERQAKIDEYGLDYSDKPVDVLSWLMDEARGEERTIPNLTRRILTLNFAAIHTTSLSFTHTLFNLASRPEYIPPLREEVEAVIGEEGWTKVAMTRLRKLDSFMKETQRVVGLGAVSMSRKALKDFTFSDGTHIPKGGFVSAVASARHSDEDLYLNAKTFNGFRFSEMREGDGQGASHQMVATSLDYLPFGHGRHACPGRFFAANELKGMLAHILLTYDIKMANEGVIPEPLWFATACIPDSKVEVLFRKRQT